ncbi:ArsR family transcriptional regulator [Knoellia sinensis KCTC 19936]|uniref:ArsR family transcriptional regulator n=1 Tax=Knoellia sinensis KCTC 19936 TaxID=1385520 RepID=A0A0A0JB88_9MICO|nr:winged helix-turn-helix domain-containing protein [Knoellia sinensis]KGN34675.1 ArsR family transcriptional regulator [Knoellia sinensis KCTC 19936]
MPPELEHDPRREVVLDATTLKALTHPLRPRILSALRLHGPATASRLAAHLGVNTGATSYHVRQLAEAGFVVEATELGNARDRWWRAAHARTIFDTQGADQETSAAYLSAVAAGYAENAQRAIAEIATLPPEWEDAGTFSNFTLRLTPDETTELMDAITTLIRSHRSHQGSIDAPPEARPVSVNLEVFLAPGMSGE